MLEADIRQRRLARPLQGLRPLLVPDGPLVIRLLVRPRKSQIYQRGRGMVKLPKKQGYVNRGVKLVVLVNKKRRVPCLPKEKMLIEIVYHVIFVS